MKLYCDPISTTSRPVLLFVAEHRLPVEIVHVDLMSEDNRSAAYLALNPNGIVPFLVDCDLRLGESTAILRYLADKIGSPAYPREPAARAKADEALDWFATNFHSYFCTMTIYPNFGVPRGLDPAVAQGLIAYGETRSPKWLEILDRHMLGGRPFVCGDQITLADYLGASFVTLGEAASFDFSPWPNVVAWIARMKARPHWDATYAGFYGLVSGLRDAAAAQA
ncbi:glutathione S-transferase family protein [Phenylobacterium sp.]|uniref:glutathione S-transferase family protein n=1 Tax=Phenylobacterium sp. TaxID=1871053 RepID=UPI0035AE62DF